MEMTSVGKMNRELISRIYSGSRRLVNGLIESGKISPPDADCEWAKMVSERMEELGFDIPSTIQRHLE